MRQSYERYFIHSLRNVLSAYMTLSDAVQAKIKMDEWLAKWSWLVNVLGGMKGVNLRIGEYQHDMGMRNDVHNDSLSNEK